MARPLADTAALLLEVGRRPGPRPRSAGPHTTLRGNVYYYVRRVPAGLVKPIGQSLIRLSLRTDLPIMAMERAAGVHAHALRLERKVMTGGLEEHRVKGLLAEALRMELERIISEQQAAVMRTDDEFDAAIEALEAENEAEGRLARRSDFEGLRPWLVDAGERACIPVHEPLDLNLGRRANKLRRDLREVEIAAVKGDPIQDAAADLVRRYSDATVDEFIAAPVTISAAIERTREMYPSKDMRGNINTCGRLLLARFGDIPITSITESMLLDFFAWSYRLPKSHGKSTNGPRRTKDEEIAIADAEDAETHAEVLAMPNLSNEERRLKLAEKLVPRLTTTTIKRYRDSTNRVFKAAHDLGVRGMIGVPGYTAVERHLKAVESELRKIDKLHVHVSKPKKRTSWSQERLATLFESPIYGGCASPQQRWKPGSVIVRDALYWVPLLLGTIGTRIKELLQLGPGDLRQRDGVLCLAIAMGPATEGKTEDSTRYVPVPQVVLDLGFAEWVAEMADRGEILLFPEVARRADKKQSSLTDAFQRIRERVWMHLDVQDYNEDCYALRKTIQSLLEAQGVGDARRQALAGHKNGSTINQHYTAVHVRSIKADIDRVSYRLVVGFSPEHGFPVIERCAIADDLPDAKMTISLGERGISSVEIIDNEERIVADCGDLTPRELAEALPMQMAERLARENFRRPQRGPRAEMADQLCAMVAVRVGAVHAVSRQSAILAETGRRTLPAEPMGIIQSRPSTPTTWSPPRSVG